MIASHPRPGIVDAGPRDAQPEDSTAPPPDTWCTHQPAHALCSDFDAPGDPLQGWDGIEWNGAPQNLPIATVPSSRSAPNAMSFAQAPSAPDGGFPLAPRLTKTFSLAPQSRVAVEFDLRIDQVGLDDDTFGMYLLELELQTVGGRSADIQFVVRKTYTEFNLWPADADAGLQPQGGQVTDVARGSWVRVKLEIESATARLSYDGAEVARFGVSGLQLPGANEVWVLAGLGNPQFQSGKSVVVFDNVTVDLE